MNKNKENWYYNPTLDRFKILSDNFDMKNQPEPIDGGGWIPSKIAIRYLKYLTESELKEYCLNYNKIREVSERAMAKRELEDSRSQVKELFK